MVFSNFTTTLPSWLLFLMMVGGITALSCLGVTAMRWYRKSRLDSHYDEQAINTASASISVMYAVLLGLMIVQACNKFDAADKVVTDESAAIVAATRNASAFPEPLRTQVETQLRLYIEDVLKDDWPSMQANHPDNIKVLPAGRELTKIWTRYGTQIAQAPLSDSFMTSLNDIGIQRAQRLALVREGVPDSLWLLLAVGSFTTICLAMFANVKKFKHHFFMIIMVSLPMAIFLWLIADLDNPFAGTLHVSQDAFLYALQVIDSIRIIG